MRMVTLPQTFLYGMILLFLAASCSSTRRLENDEYLLNKTKIEAPADEISIEDLQSYIRQKPNKRILKLKFHLFLYNLASPEKTKGISGWLRKIGEEPVVWNPLLTDRSRDQLESYLQTKGYYSGKVSDTVLYDKKKVTVCYTVAFNEPHRIRKVIYHFEDQDIQPFVYADTANSLIHPGQRFDKELLDEERQRIEESLRNKGFYKFSREFIFYTATELAAGNLVDVEITIKEDIAGTPDPETRVRHHQRYQIRNTYIYPNFELFSDKNRDWPVDTVWEHTNYILYKGKQGIRPAPVVLPNRCLPGKIYSLSNVRQTYTSYSSLRLFRLINVRFDEVRTSPLDTNAFRSLDCYIELTPRKRQSYQTEIVGTNSSGDLGARINFSYNNYSLFRGAENFNLRFTGAVEDMRKQYPKAATAFMREGGVEATLGLPKFLVPFPAQRFTMKYNPRTSINASFNYQDRPDYVRTIAGTSLSYEWKGNEFNTHRLHPLEFNYVRLPGVPDSLLINDIKNTPLINSFTDHTILSTRYTFEYTTQVIEKKKDFIYLRTNLESAGNILHSLSQLTSWVSDSNFMQVPYFRYLKADIEFQVHNQITPGNKIVYRVFTGVGYPLGKSKTLPFEKMYFSGGPNGIRAWNTFGLGPGSAVDSSKATSYATQLGDVKLEANLEYRFKLFWHIEGGLFVDAGNIWTVNKLREGSEFRWNRFYDEIALGTGLGLRFDFEFLLLRTDFGFKLRDPSLPSGARWIDSGRAPYPLRERFSFHFGIGYPF